VRWNHRVWETDRATRLDRMGSPAKWMREHYHPSCARPGLAARTCPSKLHFLFSCRLTTADTYICTYIYIFGPDRFFWGKIRRKFNHALSERASERENVRTGVVRTGVSITGALCKDTFHGRINAEMSIYLFSAENLMARVKLNYYCVS